MMKYNSLLTCVVNTYSSTHNNGPAWLQQAYHTCAQSHTWNYSLRTRQGLPSRRGGASFQHDATCMVYI
jgi:hypothetical protein